MRNMFSVQAGFSFLLSAFLLPHEDKMQDLAYTVYWYGASSWCVGGGILCAVLAVAFKESK